MKRLITLLALGATLVYPAMAQEPNRVIVIQRDAKTSAAQMEQLNKQIAEARKQLDDAQAQLSALRSAGTAAPVAPMAPVAPIAPAPPAPPAAKVTTDEVSRIGGSYTVAADEAVDGDARVLGGSLTVDGTVSGDASAIGGSLRINGKVDGDASVSGGSIYLGPHAIVRGEVLATGGSIHREPGSTVGGQLRAVGGSLREEGATDSGDSGGHPSIENAMMESPIPFPLVITFLFAGMAFLVMAPKRVDTIGRAFVNQPMYSLLVGIASIPLAVVLGVVSVITVVGPVLVAFGMVGAFFMGVTAVAVMLGRRIALGKSYRSRFYPLVVGLGVWFLASVVSHMVPPVFALMCIATSVTYMMALGAAVGTGWGKSPGWLKNRMEGNRGGTPWVDPNYTYAGTGDSYRDIK